MRCRTVTAGKEVSRTSARVAYRHTAFDWVVALVNLHRAGGRTDDGVYDVLVKHARSRMPSDTCVTLIARIRGEGAIVSVDRI